MTLPCSVSERRHTLDHQRKLIVPHTASQWDPLNFWRHHLLLCLHLAHERFNSPNTVGIFQHRGCSVSSSLCLECSPIGICLSSSLIPSSLCSNFTFDQGCPSDPISTRFLSQLTPMPSVAFFALFFHPTYLLLIHCMTSVFYLSLISSCANSI